MPEPRVALPDSLRLPAADPAAAAMARHLDAFRRLDLDGLLADYAEDATLFLSDGPRRGRAEIRAFFGVFLKDLPRGFLEAFRVRRLESTGAVGFLLWEARPWVELGVDTFVVAGDQIQVQTFASAPPA
ncbi:MAG: nuclear transport factor 2 family protein [Holophagaceae bacterium]